MFWLARELGTTVTWLLSNTTPSELVEWSAFYRIEREDRDADKRRQEAEDWVQEMNRG